MNSSPVISDALRFEQYKRAELAVAIGVTSLQVAKPDTLIDTGMQNPLVIEK